MSHATSTRSQTKQRMLLTPINTSEVSALYGDQDVHKRFKSRHSLAINGASLIKAATLD